MYFAAKAKISEFKSRTLRQRKINWLKRLKIQHMEYIESESMIQIKINKNKLKSTDMSVKAVSLCSADMY